VLSTPPAFVLSQNQTLQTKTPGQTRQNPNQKNLTKQPENIWPNKNVTPQHGGAKVRQKTNNKQKPPNTLLSSQTTHPLASVTRPRNKTAAITACSSFGQ